MTIGSEGFAVQAAMDAESRELANADFSERDMPTGEDHELHVEGKVCVYCGKEISATQAARLAGEGKWAHEDCHKPLH